MRAPTREAGKVGVYSTGMAAISFETILSEGGHTNSLGRSGEVYDICKDDPSRIGELFACISADDAWVRMRAIDTFEKLVRDDPAIVKPYLPAIFSDLTKSDQPSIQWHLAQIFQEVELDDDQEKTAIAWLENRISSTEVDWIVAANSMKSLMYFNKKGALNAEELRPLFEIQLNHHSKSVRKKAGQFLDALAGAG